MINPIRFLINLANELEVDEIPIKSIILKPYPRSKTVKLTDIPFYKGAGIVGIVQNESDFSYNDVKLFGFKNLTFDVHELIKLDYNTVRAITKYEIMFSKADTDFLKKYLLEQLFEYSYQIKRAIDTGNSQLLETYELMKAEIIPGLQYIQLFRTFMVDEVKDMIEHQLHLALLIINGKN